MLTPKNQGLEKCDHWGRGVHLCVSMPSLHYSRRLASAVAVPFNYLIASAGNVITPFQAAAANELLSGWTPHILALVE